jgi:hypothetical protein
MSHLLCTVQLTSCTRKSNWPHSHSAVAQWGSCLQGTLTECIKTMGARVLLVWEGRWQQGRGEKKPGSCNLLVEMSTSTTQIKASENLHRKDERSLEKCLIPGLGQEDHKFKVNWGYIARPCLKKKQQESLLPFPACGAGNVSHFPPHSSPLLSSYTKCRC